MYRGRRSDHWPSIHCTTNIVSSLPVVVLDISPDSKVRGANTGPIWGRQGPGGPHVSPMNFGIWVFVQSFKYIE